MQINQIKLAKKKLRKRVGRGGKRGTYCGRGIKGQKSRTGVSINPIFEGGRSTLIEHLPKRAGFHRAEKKPQIVNLSKIDRLFEDKQNVNPETLSKKGLIGNIKSGVKILANGNISKKLIVSSCFASKAAIEKIKKAGGAIEPIEKNKRSKS